MQLKQSTAATITVGPILDSTGVEYTGAVIGDLSIRKHDGSVAAMAAAATLTHSANGVYTLVLTTGNTDTLGRVQVHCNKSTYQMPIIDGDVVHANVYDAVHGSVALATATNITGGVITTVTDLTNLPTIPMNWLTADGISLGALDGKGDWNIGKTGYSLTQAFPTNFASMSITAGGIVKSDLDTIKTQTVTCGAGVTVLASVGTAATSTAQTGDNFARIGAAGAGLTDLGGMSTTMKGQVLVEASGALVTYDGFVAADYNALADAVLNRGASNVESTADKHSLGAVIMLSTNASHDGATMTAKKPSNDTTFNTYTLVVTSNHITGVS